MPDAIQVNDEKRIVHIRLRPLWAYVDGIREFARFFCSTTFDEGVADRAQLVIHEMLENAVKYSSRESDEVELAIRSDGGSIDITVANQPTPDSLELLRSEFASLSERDAETAYVEAMSRATQLPSGVSRLGLARIRFEGRFELSLTEEKDGRIRVTASGKI
ncbi:MAG TPA: ATP-binding protein [Polyangiaceae bacterium]|nr:ATP-binding protein [Polyangiaceae bacterium]